jgi:hypothetical protein
MALEIQSGLVFNSIFWLTSPRPDEVRMVETMMDDVSVICKARGIPFQRYVVPTADQLIRALTEIEDAAREGCRPLIYLDMHGSPTEGVEIAVTNEMVAWDKVVDALRAINRLTENNLLVMAGVCFGLYAIKETIITDHTPFCPTDSGNRRQMAWKGRAWAGNRHSDKEKFHSNLNCPEN